MTAKTEVETTAPAGRTSEKVAIPVRIGFGVGDFGFVLIWQGTSLFLLYFYTDVLGIKPELAGLIYFLAMVCDAVTDPVIATLADRTRTRMGKYRPWILYGAAPFALSYPIAFSAPPAMWPLGVAAWALVTHLILRTTYTVVSMPFNSLQARLTSDAQQRSVLAGFRMIGASIGGLSVVILTPLLVGKFGAEREAEAYFTAACIAGCSTFLALIYCFIAMREPEDDYAATQSLLDDLGSIGTVILKNGALLRILAIIIVGTSSITMFGQSTLYYFKYDLVRPDLVMFGLLLPAILLMITVPLWVWVAGRTSKKHSMSIGLTISLIGYLAFFANVGDSIPIAFIAIAMTGVGASALAVMFWSMLPDTVEFGEAKTGIRAEAKTFGFATLAQKAAIGINAVLFGVLLSVAGFEANVDQSEGTLLGMKAIMALIPALGCAAILLILRGYTLDQKAHKALVAEIMDRKDPTG